MRRALRSSLLALGALAVAACGNDDGLSLASFAHLTLRAANVGEPTMGTGDGGAPTISCIVRFHVASDGRSDAHMTGGVFRWYAGADRSTPVDSVALSGSDLASLFGTSGYGAGASDDVELQVTAGLPFGAALEIQYTGGQARRPIHAVAPFTCGPAPAKVAPPTVTVSLVEPSAGQVLEPGKPITLHITASSQAGLWRALVGISGPCEAHTLLNPSLAHAFSTDVTLDVPANCSLDRTITITGGALDAFAAETDVSTPTSWLLVDRTAPTLYLLFGVPRGFWNDPTISGGEYFVGDSMIFSAFPRDNHEIRAIVWEVLPSGERDSVVVQGSEKPDLALRIPVKASWGSSYQIRMWTRDAVGLESPVSESPVGAFHAYPTVARATTTRGISAQPDWLVADGPSNRLYVLQRDARRILVLSGSTLATLQTIDFPFVPSIFDVTKGGDTLFVTQGYSRVLTMVDLTGATPRFDSDTLASATGANFSNVAAMSNGKVLFPTEYDGPLVEYDPATRTDRRRTDAAALRYRARSLDHGALFLSQWGGCTQRYDAATDSFGACTPAAVDGELASSDLTGARFAGDRRVYDASSFTLISRVHVLNLPDAASSNNWNELSADGTELFSLDNQTRGVVRGRVSDGAVLDRTPLPYYPWLIRVAPDGSAIYTTGPDWANGTWSVSRIALR